MSVYIDSYQTTSGSVLVTKPIDTAIRKLIIQDTIVDLNVSHVGSCYPLFITGLAQYDKDVPLFTHPLYVPNYNNKSYLATDIRQFIRKDGSYPDTANISNYIKNLTEFNFVKGRAVLNLIWINEQLPLLTDLSFAGVVFAGLITDVISKTFALDFKDLTTLNIITHFYYQTLFYKESKFTDEIRQRMAVHTINATKTPAEFVFKVIDQIDEVRGIEDYIKYVKAILENIRLDGLNLSILNKLVINTWFSSGVNSHEVMAMALEHPPTWITLVYTAITERSYKKTTVYRVAERYSKRGLGEDFVKSYIRIVKENTIAVESLEDLKFNDFE